MQTVLRFLAIYCLAKSSHKGYSRKNLNRRSRGHNFWKKTPGIFRFVTFTLGNFRQKSFTLGNSTKLCYTHWSFQGQNPRPMEFHISSGLPQQISLLFVLTPGISTFYLFRSVPLLRNTMSSITLFEFFSGIAPYSYLLKIESC